jgi:hypothetical protein
MSEFRRNFVQNFPPVLPYQEGSHVHPMKLFKKTKVSESTMKRYPSLLKVLRIVFQKPNFDFLFIRRVDKNIEHLRKVFGDTEYNSKLLGVILKYMKLEGNNDKLYEKYRIELSRVSKILSNIRMTNEPSEKVQANWVEFKEIEKLRDRLLDSDPADMRGLVLALYTLIPPVRNDYYELKHTNYNKNTDNYYDKKKQLIVLNKYKTFKQYGRLEINLPKRLVNIIERHENNGSDYLLLNKFSKPFSETGVTKFLQSIFMKEFGTKTNNQVLRNIYVTHHLLNRNLTVKEIQNISKIMGHSISQSLLYRKFF